LASALSRTRSRMWRRVSRLRNERRSASSKEMAANGSFAKVEDESGVEAPIILGFRTIHGEMRGHPIEPHQPGRNSARELQVNAAAEGIGPSCIRGCRDLREFIIPPVGEPNQKMTENVELPKAAVGGLRPKQAEQFLAVDVFAPGRGRRSDIDHMIRELGVELACDPEIVGHDPVKFYLRAVGRQLFLASDPRAREIFRVTAEKFPFGDALS